MVTKMVFRSIAAAAAAVRIEPPSLLLGEILLAVDTNTTRADDKEQPLSFQYCTLTIMYSVGMY